jgi:hypothetical protein
MIKISKSDTLDKEQEQRDKDFFDNQRVSSHFTVGSFVVLPQNQRAEVIDRTGDLMGVRYADGSIEILRPYCLQWEK